ncbi:DUF2863 family protein [Undibacterium sp. Ren11W]|uniref:DUF2863 family protein n=1 Tax=Undibacterium sp. Ren11W TaxID=3413045 RepID=UPI003BF1B4F2
MRRSPEKKSSKLVADGLRLANLSLAVAQSASRIEDIAWQAQLDTLVAKNLQQKHQSVLDAAAEHLFKNHPNAYEVLLETMESICTSSRIEYKNEQYDVLLMVAPVLAWSRFEIASGAIPAAKIDAITSLWQQLLLSEQARLRVLPHLFAIDQLPPTHCDAYGLMEKTVFNLLKQEAPIAPQELPQTVPFLADSRYLLGVVVVPAGQPLFRWQSISSPFDCALAKSEILAKWQEQAAPVLMRLLPGCSVELLLPEAYYTGCREADIRIRPISIRSAVFYLTQTLGVEASELTAIVAGFGVQEMPGQIDEYRVSFTLSDAPEVIYGVVWPLYQQDDEINAMGNADDDNLPGELPAILTECGVSKLLRIADIFAMEFCDDCSAPLFSDKEGDLVHTEMPESAPPQGSEHFH